MLFTLDQIEEQVLITQINDSEARRCLIPTITAYNKVAKKAGTQQMNVAYLLRKRLPTFAQFLEDAGIDLEKDIHSNLRVSFGGLEIHLNNLSEDQKEDLIGSPGYRWDSISIASIFRSQFLRQGMTFKIFETEYGAIKDAYSTQLFYRGIPSSSSLDLYKYFILLQEI